MVELKQLALLPDKKQYFLKARELGLTSTEAAYALMSYAKK